MSDKYKTLTSDACRESSYQMLVNQRNRKLEKEGAVYYVVVDSKLVKHDGRKKDCQLFYDTKEYHTINDPTIDDTWGGQTTSDIVTFNTLEKPGDNEKIRKENKIKELLKKASSKVVH